MGEDVRHVQFVGDRRRTSLKSIVTSGIFATLIIVVAGIFVIAFSNQNKLSQTQIKIVETLERIISNNNSQETQLKKFVGLHTDNMKSMNNDVNELKNIVEVKFDKIDNKIEALHDRVDDLNVSRQ